MAPLAFSRSSRAFVVSSARACDHAKVSAEKAHAAHKRAIVVCRLLLIDPPVIKLGQSYAHATSIKLDVHGIASGSVSQPEQNTRKFTCPLPIPASDGDASAPQH